MNSFHLWKIHGLERLKCENIPLPIVSSQKWVKLWWNISSTDLLLTWSTVSPWLHQSLTNATLWPLTVTARVILWTVSICGKFYLFVSPPLYCSYTFGIVSQWWKLTSYFTVITLIFLKGDIGENKDDIVNGPKSHFLSPREEVSEVLLVWESKQLWLYC